MAISINDPLYSNQWHFNLIGDIEAVWEDYTGAGISVGVYDTGVDLDHPDLAGNIDISRNYPGDDGWFIYDSNGYYMHGTAVAGIIGALNNSVGGVGVAFDVSLTSVNYIGDLQNYDPYDPIGYGATFDIVNQSYGVYPDFLNAADIGDYGSSAYWEAAETLDAVTNGRGGLGTIFVKASGNEAEYDNYGNAQGSGYNNLHTVITVGAVSQTGFVESYSNYGANLLITAPSASVTTDISGTDGYSLTDYDSNFGGTSAATPVVSGVVALMLDANEGLGFRDVQNILAASASMTGSALGDAPRGYEVGPWQSLGGDTWNGGGMTYSNSYGFGLVDAYAAVRMSEVWTLMTGEAATIANEVHVYESDYSSHAISDFNTTSVTLNVTDGIVIEHVYVTIDIQHSWANDLSIDLVTPDGDVINLLENELYGDVLTGDPGINGDWTFGVAALLGESSAGDWTIEVYDSQLYDSGTLYSVSLEFVGSTVSTDDIWTFTDDFLDLQQVEAARRTIADTNGGTDWINAAAVTGNVTVNLGSAMRVDGTLWGVLDGRIENAVTGDGNDRLLGIDTDNWLMGQRGNDFILGGHGDDDLDGGDGNDVLIGDELGYYGTDISAQIYRLFNAVFDREPGVAGHQSWVTQLATGTMTLDDVAAAMIVSPEFQATYSSLTNSEFITLLFENILGRPPAQSGLDAWVSNIENGMTRAEVVRYLSEAPENVALTADALEAFEDGNDATVYAPQVYRLFEAIFGREPAPTGFEAWLANFENGMTFEEAVTAFMNTPEFTSVYGDADNETFITTLFTNVLGRPPAQSGLDAWVANLESGMTRETVVSLFVDGPEFIIRTAEALRDFMLANVGDQDTLSAGAGNSMMTGGLGADSFIFSSADDGTHVVTDIEAWDTLQFTDFGYADASAATGNMTQVGDDVEFSDQGVLITFIDTNLADIRDDQFVFV